MNILLFIVLCLLDKQCKYNPTHFITGVVDNRAFQSILQYTSVRSKFDLTCDVCLPHYMAERFSDCGKLALL